MRLWSSCSKVANITERTSACLNRRSRTFPSATLCYFRITATLFGRNGRSKEFQESAKSAPAKNGSQSNSENFPFALFSCQPYDFAFHTKCYIIYIYMCIYVCMYMYIHTHIHTHVSFFRLSIAYISFGQFHESQMRVQTQFYYRLARTSLLPSQDNQ